MLLPECFLLSPKSLKSTVQARLCCCCRICTLLGICHHLLLFFQYVPRLPDSFSINARPSGSKCLLCCGHCATGHLHFCCVFFLPELTLVGPRDGYQRTFFRCCNSVCVWLLLCHHLLYCFQTIPDKMSSFLPTVGSCVCCVFSRSSTNSSSRPSPWYI